MAVEAKLVDEISRRAKSDFPAFQDIQGLRTDVEFCAGQKLRHVLANIVFPAKPRRRAHVQKAAADTGGEDGAVEISLGQLFIALAADNRRDSVGYVSGLSCGHVCLSRM